MQYTHKRPRSTCIILKYIPRLHPALPPPHDHTHTRTPLRTLFMHICMQPYTACTHTPHHTSTPSPLSNHATAKATVARGPSHAIANTPS